MYSGEYDACDVTLSVYPHRASLKNMPDHGGNRTYDLWNTSRNISYSNRQDRVVSTVFKFYYYRKIGVSQVVDGCSDI